MGFDIDSLVGKTAEIEYEFMGDTCTLWYDPTAITQARIMEAEKTDMGFIAYFCEVIKDWDVTKGGVKVPLKPAEIEGIPTVFLRGAFWAIMRSNAAGELGKVSPNGSRRRVPQDRRPRSTATSKRRATST